MTQDLHLRFIVLCWVLNYRNSITYRFNYHVSTYCIFRHIYVDIRKKAPISAVCIHYTFLCKIFSSCWQFTTHFPVFPLGNSHSFHSPSSQETHRCWKTKPQWKILIKVILWSSELKKIFDFVLPLVDVCFPPHFLVIPRVAFSWIVIVFRRL